MNFTWSMSRLKDFERCPRLYQYRREKKVAEPPSPALERGNAVHKMVEDYLVGKAPLPASLGRFAEYIDEVKAGKGLEVEQLWKFDGAWTFTDRWDAAWFLMKMDAFYRRGRTKATVVDWKTGRIYADNAEQVRLYAAVVMFRFPEIKEVEVELCYFDQNQMIPETIKRKDIGYVKDEYNRRVVAISSEKKFNPTPGKHCDWCAFSAAKGGPCEAAARK